MLRSYDIICCECDSVEDIFMESGDKLPQCSMCGGETKRLFSSMNFKLGYNNKTDVCGWSDTGYASSQYWKHVKEAEKQTGKKHKGIYDD